MRVTWLGLSLVAALTGAATAAHAQTLDLHGRPSFGSRTLGPGFSPDPIVVPVTSGGPVDVSAMHIANGCTGYAAPNPDFQFTIAAPMPLLRVFIDAGSADTTLIIGRTDARTWCADDTYGMNPGVDIVNAQPGVYNVWVGSYRANERVRGSFVVTSNPNVQPQQAAPTPPPTPVPAPPPTPPANIPLDATRRPNFGQRRVRPGFRRDPMRIQVISGGSIAVNGIGLGSGCTGYVTANPDFVIQLTGPSPTLRVYVDHAEHSADTTLVIRKPDGTWICNDDSFGGRDPSVDLDNAVRGEYAVWIGSYQSGVQASARFNITEIRDNHP